MKSEAVRSLFLRGKHLKFQSLALLVIVILLLMLPASALSATSGNPILPGYHADPYVQYFAGKYWIYPTAEVSGSQPGSKFRAYSSVDLTNWVDEGQIFDLGPQVSWADTNGWAPSVVFRNNQYYFYFSAGGVGGGQNSRIGVAVGSSPKGPFTDIGAPLLSSKLNSPTIEAIDPHVFVDTDGQAYMYYGGSWGTSLAIVRLNSNMTSLNGSPVIVTPQNYTEAPFMSKRNGVYYMSYSNGAWNNDTYNVQYATASSPMGPWTYRGQILSSDATHKGPGHHSFLQVPNTDKWYIVYHYWDTSFSARHTAIEYLNYNGDGTIQRVVMSSTGVLPPNTVVNRFESSNFPGNFIRHANGRGRIDSNVNPLQDSQWIIRPGLANAAGVSFESVNFPGNYLRHRNGELWNDTNDGSALFRADATWYRRPGLANSSQVSFESYNFPGRYIRHRNWLLYSEPISTALDRSDATFIQR